MVGLRLAVRPHRALVRRAGEMVVLLFVLAAVPGLGGTQEQAVTRKVIHLALLGLAAVAAQGVGIVVVGLLLAVAVAV